MNEPTQLGNTWIYDGVTVGDLYMLMDNGIITLAEFYQLLKEGKIEKENVQIYLDRKNEK